MQPKAAAALSAVLPVLVLLGACSPGGEDACAGAGTQCTSTVLPITASLTSSVRIGVIPAASSVVVGGTNAFVVRDSVTGAMLLSGNAESATVSFGSVNVSTTSRRLQVTCTTSTTDRDARLAAGTSAGYPVFTEYLANCWRVYIGERPLPVSGSLEAQLKAELVAKGLATSSATWRTVNVTQGVQRYKVVKGTLVAYSSNPVRALAVDGLVTLAGRRYRGVAEVRLNSSGTLAGINELPLEEYLYGVVPCALDPIAYPELEALKAQAVVARTYTVSHRGKRAVDGYDLNDTVEDQVYGGFEVEQPLSNQAVDETAGVAATFGGAFIDALYFPASGGFTANDEEAFDSEPVAYLRGVPDQERGEALDHVPSLEVFRNHAHPRSLRAMHEGDFESDWSSLHRWTYEWSAEEMRQVLSAFAEQDVGRVLSIDVTERGPSGRALRVEYVTEAGTFVDTKDEIRASLRFLDASGALQDLPSTLLFVEPVLERRTKEVSGFRVYGGGFGHGVGLSQTGAVGMAEHGAAYGEILRHYYRGVALLQL